MIIAALLSVSVFGQSVPTADKQSDTTTTDSSDKEPVTKEASKATSSDQNSTDKKSSNDPAKNAIDWLKQQQAENKEIKDALKEEDPDFGLMIGIGSQVLDTANTDYRNQSNVLATTSLGRETPQLLTGVAFRTHIPNYFFPRYRCMLDSRKNNAKDDKPKSKDPKKPAGEEKAGQYDPIADCTNKAFLEHAEPWQRRPWGAFISIKFAPGSSETLNGFVFGASYAFAKYVNALVGFTLTPINVPSPGLRVTAAQFVTQQQAQGQYLNFNPQAMLSNSPNAFDGFPLTDQSGKLIYPGNPLTLNYRAGVIFGVSIPIYFKSIF